MARIDEPGRTKESYVVLGQMRPNNRTTLISDDLVGTTQHVGQWMLVEEAFRTGERIVGELVIEKVDEPVPVWCVPVRFKGGVIAVLVRLQGPLRGSHSLFEQQYLSVFVRLCDMVTDATFPYREDSVAGPGLPRVGDGVILMDELGRVEFATPNAVNALHRLGIYASAEGHSLNELGVQARAIERSLEFGIPSLEEVDRDHDVAISFTGSALGRSRSHGRLDARARRLRPASAQSHGLEQRGCGARGAPPSEEQPSDDLLALAPPSAAQ